MNHRVLILDDDTALTETYQEILCPLISSTPVIKSSRSSPALVKAPTSQTQVCELSIAHTSDEAISLVKQSLLKKEPYAAMFVDVKLNEKRDGIETIQILKQLDPKLLFVVVTAYQDRGVDEITRVFGEDFSAHWDFMSKPFSTEEIKQKVRHLIAYWDKREQEKQHMEKIQSQQEQLVLAERLASVGTLSRSLGHEFGNILFSIMGQAELSLKNKDPEKMKRALEIILRASEKAAVIVKNLQSMVKHETAKELHSISRPLKEAIEMIEPELIKKNITLDTHIEPQLKLKEINRVELCQAFLNILINASHALQHTERPKNITIHCEEKPETIHISIKDNGCGIEPEIIEQIFTPLFTTKGKEGSGIGLSVVKKIIQEHQGTIQVKSEKGTGTEFTIQFPLKPQKIKSSCYTPSV